MNTFYAKSANGFAKELREELTQIQSIKDIGFGDKYVQGKALTIQGHKCEVFPYNQKETGKEMIGFRIIESKPKTVRQSAK
jgi:hypothetical protein